MVQIINDPRSNPYQALASSAGRGLSAGLQSILDHKLETMRRQPIIQELQALNISPQDAAFISRLEPKDQLAALQAYQYQNQQTQQQEALQNSLGSPGFSQQQAQPQYQQQAPQQSQEPQQFKSGLIGGGTPAQNLAKQRVINSTNAPFLKKFGTALDNAESAKSSLLRMKELIQNGKVASGLKGQVLPQFLQNSDTQLFDKESNTLAGILSGQQGVPTGYKIKFALTQKPNLNQNKETQIRLIDNLLEEVEKIVLKGEIRDSLIAQNNGEQPHNIETLINQQYKQYQNLPRDIQQQFDNRERNPRQQGATEQLEGQEGQAPNEPQYNADNESPLGTAVRGGVRLASRVGETIAGTPGDIAATALGIGNYLTGGVIPSYGQIQEKLPISLPTSENLKQGIGRATQGYTNPQGGLEETADTFVQTFASLFGPTLLKGPLIKNLGKVLSPGAAQKAGTLVMPFSGTTWQKALGMTAAGEAAAGGASILGFGPLGQSVAKLGAMTAAGTAGGKKQLEANMEKSYDAAGKSIKPTKGGLHHTDNTISGAKIYNELDRIKTDLSRRSIPNKPMVQEIVKEVEQGFQKSNPAFSHGNVAGNLIPVQEVLDQKKGLNKWLRLGYSPKTPGELYLPQEAREWVQDINNVLNKELAHFGKQHPSFGKPYALAEDIFKGIKLTEALKDFGSKHGASFSTNLGSLLVKKLLLEGLIPQAGKATGPIYAAIMQNGELRRHYLDMLKAAGKNSLPEFKRAAAAMDKEAIKIYGS